VAEVIYRIRNERKVAAERERIRKGAAVGAAPSNAAADNVARRLLKNTDLKIMRFGPSDKIKDADVLKISAQEKTKEADGYPTIMNKRAKKRRKLWEREALADMEVVIGTLEMASDLQVEAAVQLILVDEAAQATEPMTLIPVKLAGTETHAVLIGDHRQLAPTVLSAGAAFDGLGGPVCLNV
jgi:superfamily I DNA and/or RNA helicase